MLFGALPIEAAGTTIRGAALAPLAVAPERQRRGIGSALARAGPDRCRPRGIAVAAVLGHPAYDPRFGFSAEIGRRLASPYAAAGDAWMVLEPIPAALGGQGGIARYPAPFGAGDRAER